MSETEFLFFFFWRGAGGPEKSSPRNRGKKKECYSGSRVYRHLDQTLPMFTYMNFRSTNVLAITIHIIERIKTGNQNQNCNQNYKNEVILHFLLSYIKSQDWYLWNLPHWLKTDLWIVSSWICIGIILVTMIPNQCCVSLIKFFCIKRKSSSHLWTTQQRSSSLPWQPTVGVNSWVLGNHTPCPMQTGSA